MRAIEPNHQVLYIWELDETATTINLHVKLPEDIKPEEIEVELTPDNGSIYVHYKDETPIIAGKLFEPIASHTVDSTEKEVTIHLQKAAEKSWPVLIVGQHPVLGFLDPNSAVVLIQIVSERDMEEASKLMVYAADLGYGPALIIFISFLMQQPGHEEQVEKLLLESINRYQIPWAMNQLAVIYIQREDKYEEGVKLFERAIKAGYQQARGIYGLMISPEFSSNCPHKDAEKAVKLIKEFIKSNDDPLIKYIYGKHLYNGTGVKQDKKEALKIREEALRTIKDLPAYQEETAKSTALWIGVATTIAAVFGAGALIFRYLKRRK